MHNPRRWIYRKDKSERIIPPPQSAVLDNVIQFKLLDPLSSLRAFIRRLNNSYIAECFPKPCGGIESV